MAVKIFILKLSTQHNIYFVQLTQAKFSLFTNLTNICYDFFRP